MVAPTWCEAPRRAVYFDVDGSVRPCCASRTAIGSTADPDRPSLDEMWAGESARLLREALGRDDLSLGCQECAFSADVLGRDSSLAVNFDRWAGPLGPAPVDLEFALSNTCNLRCVMCNGFLSSSIRAQREHLPPLPSAYDDRFFEELVPWLRTARRVAFKGGEPFLALEARRVMDLLLEVGTDAEVKVTTNATQWSDRVERYVRELRVSPIISVDAMDPARLEAIRVGVDADVLWRNVDRFQAAATAVGCATTFSYCLMRQNWMELAPLLAEADARGAYVTVAYVHQPSSSALGNGSDELLHAAIAGMEEQDRTLRLGEQHLRDTWDQARRWVARLLDRPSFAGEAVPVDIRSERAAGIPAAELEELREWSGGSVLRLSTHLGEVREAHLPPWLDVDSSTFVGRSALDLREIFGALVGRPLTAVVDIDQWSILRGSLSGAGGDVLGRVLGVRRDVDEDLHIGLSPAFRSAFEGRPRV